MPYPVDVSVITDLPAIVKAYQDLFGTGEVDQLVETIFSKQAKLIPAGKPLVEGHSGIIAFLQTHRAAGSAGVKLHPIERFASDPSGRPDVLYTRGTYTYLDKDGQTREHGNYLSVFNQEEGKYKIAYLAMSGNIIGEN